MLRATIAASVAALLGTVAPAAGQTYTWNNPAGGNWNVGTNWSGGAVPGSAQNAAIDLAGTYTVSLSDNRSVTAVTINQANATLEQTAGDLTATGLFSLQAGTLHLTGGRILANGGFTSAAGTSIQIDGGQLWANPLTVGGTAVVNSTVNWSAGELRGPGNTATAFSLNGPVNLVGTGNRELGRYGVADLNAGGTWDAGRLDLEANDTTLRLPAGQTITNTAASGKFILASGGAVGPVFDLKGTFVSRGRTTPSSGAG